MILAIIFPFELIILCMVIHELGHYAMAGFLGRRPWFEFGSLLGLPVIYSKSKRLFEVANGGDMKRAMKEEVLIAEAGLVSIVIPLILLSLFPDFWLVFFMIVFPFIVYTVWEVGSSINNCELA